MNITDYLTQHDSKPRPDGPECIRLAKAVGCSSMYLYLAALGHKTFGAEKALRLHEESIGGRLEPEAIAPAAEWHQADGGKWFYRTRPEQGEAA